jgi:hypothetical protein
MGQILRNQNWRIVTASVFSVVIIIGAYLLARSVESPNTAQASMESALLQAIATKDSDGDGLNDWEEALYGTDPHLTDTFGLGMTDGEAVSRGLIIPKAIADIRIATSSSESGADGLPPPPKEGTLTSAFAKNLFTLYLSAKQAKGGADLSENEMAEIVKQAMDELSSAISLAQDFKSAKDINISDSSPESFKLYAEQAEAVLMKNTSDATTGAVNYLKTAVENNDITALPHIVSISKSYRDSAVGLSVLPVPAELVEDHLLLVNSIMRISQITADFARVNEDTLSAILALQQYPQTVFKMGNAFININKLYRIAGVSLPAGTPGASFVSLVVDIANEQAAAKKP